ncbi:hypothetical protein [Plantactinospora sp. B5E13]|uniref:hypothetical protein n=1 Tax=unclassified Plantactinospora TaxID=2631981 RepID=UPI00325C7AB3
MKITTSRAGTPTTSSPGTDRLSPAQTSSASSTLDSSPPKESIGAGGCPSIRSLGRSRWRLSSATRRSVRGPSSSCSRSAQATNRLPYGGPYE